MTPQIEKTLCEGCSHESALVYWDTKYHGRRGLCATCGNNWPES